MSEFVEECRREWRRLGVPDPVANEMAADLSADLEEAEAEGGSPEDVLGNSAFDPRRFAAAWAVARGVTSQPARRPSASVATTRGGCPRRLHRCAHRPGRLGPSGRVPQPVLRGRRPADSGFRTWSEPDRTSRFAGTVRGDADRRRGPSPRLGSPHRRCRRPWTARRLVLVALVRFSPGPAPGGRTNPELELTSGRLRRRWHGHRPERWSRRVSLRSAGIGASVVP